MNGLFTMLCAYGRSWIDFWNHFWFEKRAADTLAVMRILVGSMLVYTHLVWTFELPVFFGQAGVLSTEYRGLFQWDPSYRWSHFEWFPSSAWLWGSHFAGLLVLLMFMLGWLTRVTGILSFLLVVSYANRATGAQFGLDQINAFLCLYLAMSDCGRAYSIDAWWRGQRGRGVVASTVMNNIATRLIQLHLCVVYLFAGLGKLQGAYWWNGEAIWGALASYEYQSIDMTWIADQMWLVNLLTLTAVTWEVTYPFLVWPRLTRPIVLLMAVAVHLGIGLFMGMLTFGLIMIYGNLAFIEPRFFRCCCGAVRTGQPLQRGDSGTEIGKAC
ncbi:MAG: HTTM domain-containing protein [Mariniblastus sp.]|nr:HTTM domain-containing protein [Mariniblastus sp.]